MNPTKTLRRAALAGAAFLSAAAFAPAQARVDLTTFQTDIKHQGNRSSCIMFSALAAIEARYKRTGPTLDLSEEFCNYVHKMMWLNRGWAPIAAGGSDFRENQVGAFGGGEGTGMLRQLSGGRFAVPLETVWPYRTSEYPVPAVWDDPYWDSQYTVNSWNLDPANLPRAALNAGVYYAGSGYNDISQPASPSAIEAVLRLGCDVVWDFNVGGNRSGPIWRATGPSPGGAHSVLICGYDRTDPNPLNWYFIVKDSYGPTSHPGGFTHVGYDFLQAYGIRAGYITGVSTPRAWPELRFLGRRNICFDGWRGKLDVYHLPHVMDTWFAASNISIADNRIGTFYDHNGVAHRVNGMVTGNTMTFWFKPAPNDNMRWDEGRETPTLGRMFTYRIVDLYGAELAGQHHDNPGSTPNPPYGGYARTPSSILANDGFLQPQFASSQPIAPEQWLGRWHLKTKGFAPDLYVMYRDDSRLLPHEVGTRAGFVSHLVEAGGNRIEFVARVLLQSPNILQLQVTVPSMGGQLTTSGRMLSWQRGVFAGFAAVGSSPAEGIYGVRYGDHQNGHYVSYGAACGPTNQRPFHEVRGWPELNEPVRLAISNVPAFTPVLLGMGLSRQQSGATPLPYHLGPLGAPSCYVRADPLITLFGVADVQGYLELTQSFSHPLLLGSHVYTQFFTLQPGSNALGLLASNGVDTLLGGSQ